MGRTQAPGCMVVSTPVGLWIATWGPNGIRRARWILDQTSIGLPWTIEEVHRPDPSDPVARFLGEWLVRYRQGAWSEALALAVFDFLAPDVMHSPFQVEVMRAVACIPPGTTRSYGAVACMVKRPQAARAVGRVMATNPVPVLVPCHRVVASRGSLGGYGAGLAVKRWLLTWERAVYSFRGVI